MASQAKAAVIAKAINDAFAAQFKQLGESVTVGNTVVTKTIKARGASFSGYHGYLRKSGHPRRPDEQESARLHRKWCDG